MSKQIKNLSQLKRALTPGAQFTITAHCRPELIGERRQVNIADTSGVYTVVPGEPENKATLANHGKGSWLGWSRAPFWSFEGETCALYDSDREHTDKTLIIAFRAEE